MPLRFRWTEHQIEAIAKHLLAPQQATATSCLILLWVKIQMIAHNRHTIVVWGAPSAPPSSPPEGGTFQIWVCPTWMRQNNRLPPLVFADLLGAFSAAGQRAIWLVMARAATVSPGVVG